MTATTTPTAPAPTKCASCDGDGFLVVERRNVDVIVDCPACHCEFCGQSTDTPPECATCAIEDDQRYRRRGDV